MKSIDKRCPACANTMHLKICDWTWYCEKCDYWGATLEVNIESKDDSVFKNEGVAITFLDDVREKNFNIILKAVKSLNLVDSKKILDIGCATGLFMIIAKDKGFDTVGIEPNPLMAKIAISQGLNVIKGYFPESIGSEKIDIIIFNDVFEHIPELNNLLMACCEALKKDGILIINLPNSKGLIFLLAKHLVAIGVTGLWKRLWQVMFYTPHLHYFSQKSLDLLVRSKGFDGPIISKELNVIGYKNLRGRVSADKDTTLISKIISFIVLIGLIPMLKLFPKDTFFSIYKKR